MFVVHFVVNLSAINGWPEWKASVFSFLDNSKWKDVCLAGCQLVGWWLPYLDFSCVWSFHCWFGLLNSRLKLVKVVFVCFFAWGVFGLNFQIRFNPMKKVAVVSKISYKTNFTCCKNTFKLCITLVKKFEKFFGTVNIYVLTLCN